MKFLALLGLFCFQFALSQEDVEAPEACAQEDTSEETVHNKFAPLRQALEAKGSGANGAKIFPKVAQKISALTPDQKQRFKSLQSATKNFKASLLKASSALENQQ